MSSPPRPLRKCARRRGGSARLLRRSGGRSAPAALLLLLLQQASSRLCVCYVCGCSIEVRERLLEDCSFAISGSWRFFFFFRLQGFGCREVFASMRFEGVVFFFFFRMI